MARPSPFTFSITPPTIGDPDFASEAQTVWGELPGAFTYMEAMADFLQTDFATELSNGTAAAPSMAFASDLDTGLYRVGANVMGFSTGGVQRALLNSAGLNTVIGATTPAAGTFTSVGVNTPSPQDTLDVGRLGAAWSGATPNAGSVALFHSGSVSAGSGAFITIAGGSTSDVGMLFADADDTAVGRVAYKHSTNTMQFFTNGSDKVNIDSAGILNILGGTVQLNGATMSGIQVTIADNAVAALTFPNRRFGLLNIMEGTDNDGFPSPGTRFFGYVDFGGTASFSTIDIGDETNISTAGPLTGTTGTDGDLNIGAGGVDGTLYIENRRGATQTINVTLV